MLSQGRPTPFCITPPDRVLPHTKRQRSHPRTPPAATLSRRLIQLQQQYPNEAVLTTGNTVEVDDSDTGVGLNRRGIERLDVRQVSKAPVEGIRETLERIELVTRKLR